MSLLRLTFPTSNLDSSLKLTTRRIYRWGDMWGILMNDKWIVERRTLLESEPLLEKVERFPSVHTAPYKVDDVWDEEIYIREDGLEMNGISSICLPGHALKQWCQKHGIPIPPSLEKYKIPDLPTPAPAPPKKQFHSQKQHSHGYKQYNSSYKPNPKPKSSGFMIQD